MEEIGFLGMGIMGKAMAMNLLRHGFKVTVWNRTLSRCDELVEHGASVGETPAAVVKKCKYTIGMLSDPTAALSVVFDKDGILEQICGGKGYIDMSTVDADTSSKISEAITSKGGYFVEAPVSGSKKPAEDGQLVILAAGEKVSADQKGRLLMSTLRLNKSSDKIKESRRTMLETEELGVLILHDLHQQRQSLLHANNTLHGVDDNIGSSKKILTAMSRRMSRNKWIICSFIAVFEFFWLE